MKKERTRTTTAVLVRIGYPSGTDDGILYLIFYGKDPFTGMSPKKSGRMAAGRPLGFRGVSDP
jgi:hypothetical protein